MWSTPTSTRPWVALSKNMYYSKGKPWVLDGAAAHGLGRGGRVSKFVLAEAI